MKQVIQALPGFVALNLVHEGEGPFVECSQSPVIAWVVEVVDRDAYDWYTNITAVSSDGMEVDAVLRPDGVICDWAGWFQSIDEWIAAVNAQRFNVK